MIVACVRNGTKYSVDYVYKLKAMVERHLGTPHWFVCLTDRPEELQDVMTVNIERHMLPGWFAKMALFEPTWRRGQRVLYFDLDTVICDSLDELAALDVEFGICANFTKRAGFRMLCNYGSCVMTIGANELERVWEEFVDECPRWISAAGPHGDQWIIEKLVPVATLLQDALRPEFFLGYRDLTDTKPPGCSVVIFAGNQKPHNCNEEWIAREWTL
jgi:hypothetical protein